MFWDLPRKLHNFLRLGWVLDGLVLHKLVLNVLLGFRVVEAIFREHLPSFATCPHLKNPPYECTGCPPSLVKLMLDPQQRAQLRCVCPPAEEIRPLRCRYFARKHAKRWDVTARLTCCRLWFSLWLWHLWHGKPSHPMRNEETENVASKSLSCVATRTAICGKDSSDSSGL